MSRGHGKGSAYERAMSKRLSLWVSGMARKDLFWRSSMSGGRATVGRRKGELLDHIAGDICCTSSDGEGQELIQLFVIECKHYRDLHLDRFFHGNGSKEVLEWWEKLLGECRGKREPLLLMKQNNCGEVAFTSPRGIRLLRAGGKVSPHLYVPTPIAPMLVLHTPDIFDLSFKRIARAAKV